MFSHLQFLLLLDSNDKKIKAIKTRNLRILNLKLAKELNEK